METRRTSSAAKPVSAAKVFTTLPTDVNEEDAMKQAAVKKAGPDPGVCGFIARFCFPRPAATSDREIEKHASVVQKHARGHLSRKGGSPKKKRPTERRAGRGGVPALATVDGLNTRSPTVLSERVHVSPALYLGNRRSSPYTSRIWSEPQSERPTEKSPAHFRNGVAGGVSDRRAKSTQELELIQALHEVEKARGVSDDTTPRGGTPIKRGGAKATTAYFDQFMTKLDT